IILITYLLYLNHVIIERPATPTVNPRPGPSSTRPIEGTRRTPLGRRNSYLSGPEGVDSPLAYRASALPFGPDRSAMLHCPAESATARLPHGRGESRDNAPPPYFRLRECRRSRLGAARSSDHLHETLQPAL